MDGGPAPRGTFAPVALSGGRPPVGRWLAIIGILLIIAVAKPWPSPAGSDGSGAAPGPAIRSGSAAPLTPPPSPSSSEAGAGPQVSGFCLDPGTWLIASVERWRDQQIRVWRALEPATKASGPDDTAIPIIPVVSEGLTELGWCAPVRGAGRPSTPAVVTAWLRSASPARPIVPAISRPIAGRSPFGELYRSPSGSTFWSSGTYVFRYQESDRRQHWFAIDVEIRPSPPRPTQSRAP